jgi:uncharacterized Zn-finger protein
MDDSWIGFEWVNDHRGRQTPPVLWRSGCVQIELFRLGNPPSRRYGAPHSIEIERLAMADRIVPHFHNERGVAVIEIGAREFKCIGALPPNDHPHVYLDMGDDNEIICPYCSTLYRHEPSLDPHTARPEDCALPDAA